jgi:hypothetical protein
VTRPSSCDDYFDYFLSDPGPPPRFGPVTVLLLIALVIAAGVLWLTDRLGALWRWL